MFSYGRGTPVLYGPRSALFVMSEATLYLLLNFTVVRPGMCRSLLGYLAHKKPPPPPLGLS